MTFVKRKIELTFRLGKGLFEDSGGLGDTVTVKDLRISAKIAKAGTPTPTANVRIYGLTASLMNKLSNAGSRINLVKKDSVTIKAGDDASALGVVFVGTIMMAWVDFQGVPEAVLEIVAQSGNAEAVISAKPTSFSDSVDIPTAMLGFATKMGLAFENNGVEGKLPVSYFPGTLKEQAQKCAKDGGFEISFDIGKLVIWPRDGSRGGLVPEVSPESGMVLYPTYTAWGIMFRTVFNPSINFGGDVIVKSQMPSANRKWRVNSISHDLESETPNGQWFSVIDGQDTSQKKGDSPPPVPGT